MSLPSPGQARVRQCSIKGVDLTNYVREFSVFESIFRPYQSAEIILIDNNNILGTLQLQGGEDATLIFDCGYGRVYDMKLKVMSTINESFAQGLRASGMKISLVGAPFLSNEMQKIQKSFLGITGTAAIEQIHGMLGASDAGLSTTASKGMLGEREPFIISNMKPYDAIQTIRTRLTSDAYPTGSYTYFRNNSSYVLKPLEELFATMSPNEHLIHDATMGKSYLDAYKQARNIIGYEAKASFTQGGRFSIADILRTQAGALVSTFKTVSAAYQAGQTSNPSAGRSGGETPTASIGGGAAGNAARTFANFAHDQRLETFSSLAEKSAGEQRYINEVKNGPVCTVQVMMDSGINCTVGQGVYANIAQPIGDMGTVTGFNRVGGLMLCINLKHHVKMYDSSPRATTVMELAKGGFNV